MNVTKKTIEYCAAPYGFIATIPAGTQVDPATNLPGNQFWACAWETMDDTAAGWHRNYGFLIQASDVETVPDPEPESAIDPACECTECGYIHNPNESCIVDTSSDSSNNEPVGVAVVNVDDGFDPFAASDPIE